MTDLETLSPPSAETRRTEIWGTPPSAAYALLASRFRPVFERIRAGAVEREIDRRLPHDEINWLKEAGFGALRVPREHGGLGATLPELFALLSELAEADSNITQALRAHFAYVEDVLNAPPGPRRDTWFARFVKGEIVGSAWTEVGAAKVGSFATRVTRSDNGLILNGAKFYTTGSIFAEWIDVGAVDEADTWVQVAISATAPGVTILDDWNGFGQKLTGSGTATFTNAPVAAGEVRPAEERFAYSAGFVQQVHLATLTGIARAAAADVAQAVAERQRTYSHAAAARSSEDPQVLQVVGRIRSLAYAAGAIVSRTSDALQNAYEAGQGGSPQAVEAANIAVELEIAAAQTVVADLVLRATGSVFDALGASATSTAKSLDRYWRNARTISSHNPLIYKERIVGDYAVNGTPPPFQWRIGHV